jgi:hypothetical protein
MRLMIVEFDELYARHLCRHSQYGINVAHLLALLGTWFGVYGAVYWLLRSEWVLFGLAAGYLLAMTPSLPVRVLLASAAFMAGLVALVLWLPLLPLWAYLLMVPVCYKLQSWSHRLFTLERDMTEFNRKYRKGSVLFVVLLVYEIPLVLNYLLFDHKSWRRDLCGGSLTTSATNRAGSAGCDGDVLLGHPVTGGHRAEERHQ